MDLTIFTPTYNRVEKLYKLYESLCKQTNNSFKWLIVDDGSVDNTKDIVAKWIEESKISISYIYQENQGKHIAHNRGVEECDTELFLCVDSDDYLLEHAVESIYSESIHIISEDFVSGIVTARIDKKGNPIRGKLLPEFIKYSSLSHLYEKYKFRGDTSLVFKTAILRRYKFPKISGEKFVGEEYIYAQIDEKYVLYVSNKKYYVCEYMDDGYTKNIFSLISNNPRGYMMLKQMKLKVSKSFITKYKSAALYIVGGWLSGIGSITLIQKSPKKLITALALPLALIVRTIRFKKR